MSRLHLHILGSGSKGNCALVEGPQGLIMIDNGLSRRETLKRMAELGLSADDVAALVITHEHGDHIKGLDVWCKHWHGPLFASRDTLSCKENLAHLPVEEFDPGDTLPIAGIHVQTYSTSHDVINPVGYRFNALDDSIGFATDTGELSSKAIGILKDCRVLALESNHDVTMLREGAYPRFLQERILSTKGHLSNNQAAEAARELVTDRTEQLIAMHISQDNNRPSLTVKAMPTRLMQVSMMNSAVLPPVFKGRGSSRYALQASINRQPFNSPSRQQRGAGNHFPAPLNSYSRLKQSHR